MAIDRPWIPSPARSAYEAACVAAERAFDAASSSPEILAAAARGWDMSIPFEDRAAARYEMWTLSEPARRALDAAREEAQVVLYRDRV